MTKADNVNETRFSIETKIKILFITISVGALIVLTYLTCEYVHHLWMKFTL